MKEEEVPTDLENWFETTFGEKPNYSNLLKALSNTPIERMNLLKRYFEPSERDVEEGSKEPTQAHFEIAKLVKLGYIKMILTTNFDRLMEKALEEEGIVPTVIIPPNNLDSALPFTHSDCTLVKLHGDYLDPDSMKNTIEELSNYSNELNTYIDRIFDEFGIIVCGWSATWDKALYNAIMRCTTRRFWTYWLKRGTINIDSKRIIDHRKAEIVQIESADKFFIELGNKLVSINELQMEHPLSIDTAVQTVKRYLMDPLKRIRLNELIDNEIEIVFDKLISVCSPINISHV